MTMKKPRRESGTNEFTRIESALSEETPTTCPMTVFGMISIGVTATKRCAFCTSLNRSEKSLMRSASIFCSAGMRTAFRHRWIAGLVQSQNHFEFRHESFESARQTWEETIVENVLRHVDLAAKREERMHPGRERSGE
jgi:hypothetical protein